jgi:hypothetical protein
MAEKIDNKELWIDWTHDAAAAYAKPEDLDDADAVDDMVEFTTEYADAMLDELDERFGGSTTSKRRRSKRKKDDDE